MEWCIKTQFSLQNHVRLLENYFSQTVFAQSVSRESNFKLNLFRHLLLYRVYMFFWFAVFDWLIDTHEYFGKSESRNAV